MEPFVLVPVSVYSNKSLSLQSITKQDLPKYRVEQNLTYQIDQLKKEKKYWELFDKADSLVFKIWTSPRIKLSHSQTLFLGVVETGFSLSDFAQQLRRKNADVPHTYITRLDAAGVSATLRSNQNATAKGIGSWVPFKTWASAAVKVVHTGSCCIWVCAKSIGN